MRNDLMKVDIREHKPLRADVHSGLKTLLVQARQIWGGETRSEDTRGCPRFNDRDGFQAKPRKKTAVATHCRKAMRP